MVHNHDKAVWNLASGIWVQDDQVGYILKSTPNLNVENHVNPHFVQQLLNLPTLAGKVYPPEFLYDPETGTPLEKKQVDSEAYWLPPYGQGRHYDDNRQSMDSHGLQLSHQLKKLKNEPQIDADAEQKIKMPPRGIFEFVSIKASTEIPQLVAYNKINGNLLIWSQNNQEWLELKAVAHRLEGCPEQLEEYLQLLGVVNEAGVQTLYIPTKAGLARVIIDGLSLSYRAEYVTPSNSLCLGTPVYWNKTILIPILIADQVKLFNVSNQASIMLDHTISEMYFEKVVYDTSRIIWVGTSGQLIVKYKSSDDEVLNAIYKIWVPSYTPDFRFGAPYDNQKGSFYQFGTTQNNEKGPLCYIELDSEDQFDKSLEKSPSFRFTTGLSKFALDGKLEIKQDIWKETSAVESTHRFTVPMIEDEKKQLIFGFSFDTETNVGIEQKLADDTKQDIKLFIDTHDGLIDFHRVQVEKPLQSRFFIHQNVLYFYNSSLTDILGWELAV
ncbi:MULTISPECIES: hypothetical protein [unclassified Acinetobacter]|uniref:hypothetical protein n=1 Tax=unclassified Acinetobacter TaxID=196816 RepID=UPI0015D13554|nr:MULTISPECIES: hypothetical protein [unclassified Acinetobacter]UUS60114.1 hypothetical protein MST17_12200 [Acinetobacter sp. YH16056_T]